MKKPRYFYRNNRIGMTLIEIIVVIVLSSMVMLVTYLIFSTSMSVYKETSVRIDAQSQFRLVMDILEKEVGNAKIVKLETIIDASIEPVSAGASTDYSYIYIKPNVSANKNALYIKSYGSAAKAYSPPFPLPGFTISFRPDSIKPTKIITVTLHADGTDDYIGSVMVQNTTIDGTTTGNAVYFEGELF